MEFFLHDIAGFLDQDQILDDPTDLKLYETDATSLFPSKAKLVLLPNTVEELSKIIQSIHNYNDTKPAHKLSFLARGAGTGLSGGAIARSHSVIISMARFTKIINIDLENEVALVEAGVVNASLNKILKDSSLHFAPDPSSQQACTIGGNLAENAGGVHCFKYGVTSEHVLGMEFVNSDGELAYFGALNENLEFEPSAADIDISSLIVGSEGTFGIATKILLKLTPIPQSFITIQAAFASTQSCGKLVSDIVKQGFKPAALETVDNNAVKAINAAYNLGFSDDVKAVILIELDGEPGELQRERNQIKELIDSYSPVSVAETQDAVERLKSWKGRKGAAAAFGKIAPYWYLYDLVVPRSKIPNALHGLEKIADKYKLLLANILHAGDGNIHPNFLYDPDKEPDVVDRIHKASHEIMELCVSLDGTLSGEHGIGIEKQEYMSELFSDMDMKKMLMLREVFDPHYISNPDKIFPIRICRECHRDYDLEQFKS